jgi:hypothetical protein
VSIALSGKPIGLCEADRAEFEKLDTRADNFLQKDNAVEAVADAEMAPYSSSEQKY